MMKRSFLFLTVYMFFIPSLSFASLLPGGPESLDTSFNQTGFKLVQQGSNTLQELTCVAVQPDNKTVYAGFNYLGYAYYVGIVMRLNEDGSLDETFNSAGTVSGTPGIAIFSPNDYNTFLYGLVLQPDGKIVVCGSNFDGTDIKSITARFTSDGLLDTQTYNAPDGYTNDRFTYNSAELYDLVLQPDGSIVTVGYVGVTYTGSPYTQANLLTSHPVVARYTSVGALDTTFNGTGYNVNTAINSTIIHEYDVAVACHTGVIIEPIDGNILITGTGITTAWWYNGSLIHTLPVPELGNMYLTRYDSDGIIVNNPIFPYGSDSEVINYFTSAFQLTLQLDGKAIVVGNSSTGDDGLLYMCTRLLTTPDFFGLPDITFNETGYNIFTGTNTWSSAFGVAMQENQQIVTGGTSYAADFVSNLMITRFNQNGTIDPSCSFEFETGDEMYCYDVAVDLNGKIIGAGYLYNRTTFLWDLAAIRFIGGQTPEPGPTAAINLYGYNSAFLSEFLYVSTYAQTIIDPIAQAAAITAVNDLVDAYILAYDHQQLVQSNFNFITYLYLIKTGLLATQVILVADYAGSTTEINQFFDYLFERIEILAA